MLMLSFVRLTDSRNFGTRHRQIVRRVLGVKRAQKNRTALHTFAIEHTRTHGAQSAIPFAAPLGTPPNPAGTRKRESFFFFCGTHGL